VPAEVAAETTKSVQEVFLDARKQLQDWVDDPVNRPLVLAADMGAIKGSDSVCALIQPYWVYGSVMQDKLWKHLAFLVENRKKFLIAFGFAQ
jgi:hypothetical protein